MQRQNKWFRVCLWLLLSLTCTAALAAHETGRDAAVCDLAGQFVCRLDAGDYSGAWMALDAHARLLKTAQDWQRYQAAIRSAYGPLQQRRFRSLDHRGTYSQHPDGDYVVVCFDSRFADKQAAIETVVLRQEPAGAVSIIAYYIN